ncbi:MAG: response regulator [Actinobacteria bacterium]|nr:response regulator [Actinomycetota bacterium]
MNAPQRTVLVVDDEPSLRLLCRVNLELDGYRVLEAASVDAAREQLSAGGVDVVLLDIHVGAASGLELLDDIEALELPVRVVMLSGTSEISPQVRARVDGVLGKPFDLEDLAAAVSGERSGRLPDR